MTTSESINDWIHTANRLARRRHDQLENWLIDHTVICFAIFKAYVNNPADERFSEPLRAYLRNLNNLGGGDGA